MSHNESVLSRVTFYSLTSLSISSARQQCCHKLWIKCNSTICPRRSHYKIMITAQTMPDFNEELWKFLVFALDVSARIKSWKSTLMIPIYCVPATVLYEISSSFSLWIWHFALEWTNCTTLQYLQGSDDYAKEKSHDCKKKCELLEAPAARITKFLIRTFVQVSALTFSVHICSPPAVLCVFFFTPACSSQLIFPASNFHAIMRCFVLTRDELHGFKGNC